MTPRTKLLLAGVTLCLLGAGFDSPPVLVVGIVLTVVGLIMSLKGRL